MRPARRLKVVLDCGNGTAVLLREEAYRRAGFDVVPLYCDPDPTFPNHFPNPSETANRLAVRRKVVEVGADLGLSFDGDGDRVGVEDERGQGVNADLVLMLLARQVLARKPGAPDRLRREVLAGADRGHRRPRRRARDVEDRPLATSSRR